MTRRFIHFSPLVLRWLAIALLLAIPVGSGIAYAVGLAKHRAVVVLRRNSMGETGIEYLVEYGAISVDYMSDWAGTPPRNGLLYGFPGLRIARYVGVSYGQARGYAELVFFVRWWLLLLVNLFLTFCCPSASRGRCCGGVSCRAAVPSAATTFAPRPTDAPSAARKRDRHRHPRGKIWA